MLFKRLALILGLLVTIPAFPVDNDQSLKNKITWFAVPSWQQIKKTVSLHTRKIIAIGALMVTGIVAGYFGYKWINSKSTLPDQDQDLINACKGSVLGAAVGDALGRVTEFITPINTIFAKYPNGVRTFADFTAADWQGTQALTGSAAIAPYTDDTAMSKIVMDVLIDAQKNEWDLNTGMDHLARAFVADMKQPAGWAAPMRAPGICCKDYCAILDNKINTAQTAAPRWWDVSPANGKTGGCGSVMRAHPFGLIFCNDPKKAELWAVEQSKLTHGDHIALAACAALAVGVVHSVPVSGRTVKTSHEIIELMIAAAARYDQATADMMRKAVNYATQAQPLLQPYSNDVVAALKDATGAFRKLHEQVVTEFLGWAAHHAIAATIYLYALLPNQLEQALYLGVNTPGDSDSIASMIGALIGARLGIQKLPQQLWRTVEGSVQLQKLAGDMAVQVIKK